MSTLDVDFNDVPDSIPPIAPGEYEVEVVGVPEWKDDKKLTGKNLVVVLRIVDEGQFKGRMLTDYISNKIDSWKVRVKRLILAAGFKPGMGFDLTELAGRKVRVTVTARTYKDDSGQEQQSANLKDYIIA